MTEQSPAEAVFFAALERTSPAARAAYLDEACAGQPGLRARVEKLLAAHPQVGDFLEPPPPASALTRSAIDLTATRDPAATRPGPTAPLATEGEVIGGKYHLIDEVGSGGMGSVWRAEQRTPVKRKVAVKLIKAGMDSKAVLARFDAERQALAVMDHPHIAKVLDGGLHAGRPYFVMELVKGVPITTFCDERKLTPQQRLELFVPVCQAIQHAHQKGVIHRDIKPSNVLVALYDDRPVPKVIDFGVAKATGAALTDHTFETGFGAILGTPLYMSPEQASLNNLDVDTRSDVYSLGVLLYELLTGSPPFTRKELEQKGLFELFRVLREEEPPRPSHKLSTADTLPSIAATRGTEPKRLTGLLRNELDWIVMKALEKDRARRYDTANGFAADVLRYLSGEPVQAHPPSTAYRLKKFVRKHRTAVLVSAVVGVAALTGLTGGWYGLVKAGHERTADGLRVQAESARDTAEAAGKEAERQRASATAAWREVELQRDKLAVFEYGRAVQLAYEAWRDNRLADARLLLADADPGLRGWEWQLVHRLCHADVLTLGTPKGVGAVAVSPDGKAIATGGRDGHLVLWDAATGGMKSTLRKDLREVHGVAFDPTGKRLLTTSRGTQRARVLDAATGADLVVIDTTAHGLFPPAAAFSSDGRRVVVSTTYGAKVVGANDGRLLLTLDEDAKQGITQAVAFNHDGSRVATYNGALVRVWDAATGKLLHSLPARPGSMSSGSWVDNGPTSVNFSPDGERLMASSKDGVIWVWPAAGGEPVVLQGRSVGATAAAFSPDGSRVATAGTDGTIRVWDPKGGAELIVFKGHAGAASGVAFTPDGKRLVSGGDAGRVWDLGGREYAVSVSQDLIRAAAFSPDGTRFATAGERGPVRVWDARTGASLLALDGHRTWVEAVGFSPDGKWAVTGSVDQTAIVWDATTGAITRTMKGHGAPVSTAMFSRDGTRLLTVGVGARLWEASTGADLYTFPESGGGVHAASFAPNGLRVATAEGSGAARIWDTRTGAELMRLKGHPKAAVATAFSTNGARLVVGHSDGVVRMWDVTTGAELFTLRGHTDYVKRTEFSPDGSRLLTGSWDGTVRLWEAKLGAPLLSLKEWRHSTGISAATFSPDGTRVLVAWRGSDGGGVHVLDPTPVNRAFRLDSSQARPPRQADK